MKSIRFNTPMVRATMREDNPKTQTRRVIDPQPSAAEELLREVARENELLREVVGKCRGDFGLTLRFIRALNNVLEQTVALLEKQRAEALTANRYIAGYIKLLDSDRHDDAFKAREKMVVLGMSDRVLQANGLVTSAARTRQEAERE